MPSVYLSPSDLVKLETFNVLYEFYGADVALKMIQETGLRIVVDDQIEKREMARLSKALSATVARKVAAKYPGMGKK